MTRNKGCHNTDQWISFDLEDEIKEAMDNESERNVNIVDKVDGAIRQAAEKILERAKQTRTPLVIWEDDQIKEVSPEKMEQRIAAGPSEVGA